MKATCSLSGLEDRLAQREASFRDLTIPASAVRMEPERGDLLIHGVRRPVQDHVLTLLGPKLGIPAAYLRRCPPELRARNVIHWMERLGQKELFVRFDGEAVRAVLSTRYIPVSNAELLAQLRSYLPHGADPEVKAEVTPTKMVTQVVLPEHQKLMSVGDEVQGGLSIMNSEVGFASVEVATFLHRLICTNGMVVREKGVSFRRVHLKTRENLAQELDGAFHRAVAGVPRAFDAMHSARAITLQSPEKALEHLGLTKEQHRAALAAFQEEPGDTQYHIVNALTGAARSSFLSLDSRLHLQSLAGSILPN